LAIFPVLLFAMMISSLGLLLSLCVFGGTAAATADAAAAAAATADADRPPNFLILLVDDMGYGNEGRE
jgi:hypothetical protein